jgi:glycosylphosphatidylinositol transamidase
LKSLSLLLLGTVLASLSTLNFSLSLLIGLLATPLTFLTPLPAYPTITALIGAILGCVSPCLVVYAASQFAGLELAWVLKEAAFGWDVWGMRTQVVVWCFWWPAWLVGNIILLGKPQEEVDAQAKISELRQKVERILESKEKK